MPDGVALLNVDSQVLWCNERLKQMLPEGTECVGMEFLDAFGTPEIMGPDFCPVHTALGSGETARSTLRTGEKQYAQIDVTPVSEDGDFPSYLVAVARDVSEEVLQRQKLNAIYQAGLELGDLETVGYKGGTLFPLTVRLERPGEALSLRAVIDYQACEKICVPFTATIALDLPAGPL